MGPGIWDPPIALGQAPAAAEATVPVFAPTTDPATGLQVTTEARPVPANPTQVPQTTRETIATSTISSQAAPHSTQTADVPKTTFVDPTTSIHFSFDPETPTSPNLVDTTPSSHTKGSTVTVNVVGTNFVIGGHTLGVGSATTINGQRLSHASSNIVVGTGAAAATMPVDASSLLQQITLGTATVNIGKLDTGVVQIGSQKLTVGGSVQTIEGHVVSAGTSALIVGQGSSPSTTTRTFRQSLLAMKF
ncbi:uncharacterized protein K489DRAFT_376715 [Dissoconium aciculare CBS 342.82]|uniref:Uncharacterized protein n=1 Tax=Dissoconium aciculare CBS 342.82 TaxID=1314786 RepID=A0A6J3MHE1_9PEZI|nr:uncharacterized protein K489DRAFT_376715 [Dissoconium aciculare CBS 342.82]KAF1826312.1 hypothetical protein K489DRAFT_376715 [Dissoconium aciculare CBS 342.82]